MLAVQVWVTCLGNSKRDLGDRSLVRGQECGHTEGKALAGLTASACFRASGFSRYVHTSHLGFSDSKRVRTVTHSLPGSMNLLSEEACHSEGAQSLPQHQDQQGGDTPISTGSMEHGGYNPVRSSQNCFNFNVF